MSGIGHVGELRVMQYLEKKKGLEIYLPLKDKGIDFIAAKNEKYFQIQVKSSMFQKGSYFWFDLYKQKMRYGESIFYIFVCITLNRRRFMGKSENYIIIPSLKLKEWIETGNIASKMNDDNCLNIFLYPDYENLKWIYKNKGKELDWTEYWNEFKWFD